MTSTYYDRRFYQTGDLIFSEGDTGGEMFIVQEGRVAVTSQVGGREVFLTALERGDFFGEVTLLNGEPRHATCFALAPTILVAIRSGDLLVKLRRDPTFALEMLQRLSRRISFLERQVTKLLEDQMLSQQELTKTLAKSEYRMHKL